MKLYVLLAAVLILSFFSNDFGLVDIQKTAIILAAGVDRTEEGFSVTAQISVPKGSDRKTGGTSSVEVAGEGKTVSDCFSQIYTKTGWVPKLVFCDLVLLGEETVKEDVLSALDFFLRYEYMPASCLIAACEGKASDLLESQSAIHDTSSIAVVGVFSDAAVKSGKVLKRTLKDFGEGYYSVSKSDYMPFVRPLPQEGAQGSNGGSGESGGASGEEKQMLYSARETAIFYGGRMTALLDADETFAFSLLQGNVVAGELTLEKEDGDVSLTVLKNNGKISFSTKDGPKAKLSVDLKVRLFSRGVPAPIDDIANSFVSPELQQKAEEKIDALLGRLWQESKESGCDLFLFTRSLYRSSLKEYERYREDLLERVQVEIRTNVTGVN